MVMNHPLKMRDTERLEAYTKIIPSCKELQKMLEIAWLGAGVYYSRVGNGCECQYRYRPYA